MLREEQDKKNKRIGLIISTAAHIAVIVLFIFLVAWRAPNPPHPEIGIELNFGTSNEGTGDIQPEPLTTPTETESEVDAPETPEEILEEVVEEPTEEITEPVDEVIEPAVEEAVETEPAVVTPVTEQPTEAPVNEPEVNKEEKKEEQKKVVTEEPKELPKVLYPGSKDGQADEAKNANQGDKTDAVGDQGDEEGQVDSRALYGKPGGGDGGAALEMAGWMWDRPPNPNENTSEDGKIVFEVTIDERGEVIASRAINYTVSASLVKVYQAEVERLTFSKTSSGTAPSSTKGVITFIIKTK